MIKTIEVDGKRVKLQVPSEDFLHIL